MPLILAENGPYAGQLVAAPEPPASPPWSYVEFTVTDARGELPPTPYAAFRMPDGGVRITVVE